MAGVRSSASADYAAGASWVLVIVPLGNAELFLSEKPLDQAVEELRAGGAEVAIVPPDAARTRWTWAHASPPRRRDARRAAA